MDHDEVYEDTGDNKEHESLRLLKSDMLSTAFCYVKYSKVMKD